MQSTDLFRNASWNMVQSHGSTCWPMQSVEGKPSTRETTNRSRCGKCNLTSSAQHHLNRFSLRALYKPYLYPRAYMNETKRGKYGGHSRERTELAVLIRNNVVSRSVHLRDHHYLIRYLLISYFVTQKPLCRLYQHHQSHQMMTVSETEQNNVLAVGTLLTVVQNKIRFNLIISILKKSLTDHIYKIMSQTVFESLYTLITGSLNLALHKVPGPVKNIFICC
jgi:protein-arginine kinase activator protein McsA